MKQRLLRIVLVPTFVLAMLAIVSIASTQMTTAAYASVKDSTSQTANNKIAVSSKASASATEGRGAIVAPVPGPGQLVVTWGSLNGTYPTITFTVTTPNGTTSTISGASGVLVYTAPANVHGYFHATITCKGCGQFPGPNGPIYIPDQFSITPYVVPGTEGGVVSGTVTDAAPVVISTPFQL